MLIIDNYNNYIFVKFNKYCKFNNITIVNMFACSFHLLQLLNIRFYSFLKFAYNRQINFLLAFLSNTSFKLNFLLHI